MTPRLLPPNTRELLLGLHAEFYQGPLAHADAFRILPRVAEALDRAGLMERPPQDRTGLEWWMDRPDLGTGGVKR